MLKPTSQIDKEVEEMQAINRVKETLETMRREEYRIVKDWERLTAVEMGFVKPMEHTIDADTVKEIPMDEVLKFYGIEAKRGMINCPIHGEKTPSCKIYHNTNSFYCFGCHKGGSPIDFVM